MKTQFSSHDICVFESALFRTTSTVITTADLVLVVDPNWLPEEVEAIHRYARQQAQGLRPIYILFTHSDYDHIIGYKAFPNAQTIASAAFVSNPDKEAIIKQIRDFDDEYYIARNYPIEYPEIDHIIGQDDQILEIGHTRIRFWQAPGHNADGLFALVEPLGYWIAGDYLSNIEFPYIYHSSRDYEQTLQKAIQIIETHKPRVLIPGHGDYTCVADEMKHRIEESHDYLYQLRWHVQQGLPYPVELLWHKYHFPGIMSKFHQGNIDLISKELAIS